MRAFLVLTIKGSPNLSVIAIYGLPELSRRELGLLQEALFFSQS